MDSTVHNRCSHSSASTLQASVPSTNIHHDDCQATNHEVAVIIGGTNSSHDFKDVEVYSYFDHLKVVVIWLISPLNPIYFHTILSFTLEIFQPHLF